MPGRHLNDIELESYDVLDRALAERVTVHEIPALPGSYVGLSLGRHVFLAVDVPDDGSSTLLAHELVHVRQWRDRGAIPFAASYVGAFVRGLLTTRSWNESYRRIPAEIEARRAAAHWARRRPAVR